MDGEKRHMHMGTFYKRNPGGQLHRLLVKEWPNEFEHKSVAIKVKTWYKGDLGDGTWIDYLSKDGKPITNQADDFDWHELLADDKAVDERRKQAWQQMHYYSELFKTYELPHTTVFEVWQGLETLAYVLKVSSLPRMSDRRALMVDLFHYMNSTTGSLDTADEFTASRKRKREPEEPVQHALANKYGVHGVRQGFF